MQTCNARLNNLPILECMVTPSRAPPPATSLFARVQASLRADILENRLPPGAKLPSEAALEKSFGVSRITVRHALSDLHAEGLIEKVNGKGSFVTRPDDAPRLGPLTGFYEHMRASGGVARGKTLSVRQGKACAAVAQALRIAPGTPLLTATLLRWVNDEPIAYGTIQGEPEMTRAVLAQDLDVNDVMVVLESRLGYRLKNSHIEAGAVAAGKKRGRLLQVEAAAPLLRISFTPHDVTDKPLMFSEMYFRADKFNYKAVLKR